ncbi:hypothetical protein PoB_001974700 [Plakobranchus ocellatus]|uniref:Uncharacterized protein n=1 Tax=Plakobranchus ocellatus TaxID=259542 RepID=A0AAV3ZD69_9GAST|nr:hypothetical protein PoB_001974700 [Plakobranchus ocellatus]
MHNIQFFMSALGGLTPSVTIPGSEPLSSFDIPVGILEFKRWQIGSGDDCELAFFGLYVNDSPILAYVYDDNEDGSREEIVQQAEPLGYKGEKREEYLKLKFRQLAEQERKRQRQEREAERAERESETDRTFQLKGEEAERQKEIVLKKIRIQAAGVKVELQKSSIGGTDAQAKIPNLHNFADVKDDLDD